MPPDYMTNVGNIVGIIIFGGLKSEAFCVPRIGHF